VSRVAPSIRSGWTADRKPAGSQSTERKAQLIKNTEGFCGYSTLSPKTNHGLDGRQCKVCCLAYLMTLCFLLSLCRGTRRYSRAVCENGM
jgi:hypothetical protein